MSHDAGCHKHLYLRWRLLHFERDSEKTAFLTLLNPAWDSGAVQPPQNYVFKKARFDKVNVLIGTYAFEKAGSEAIE